MYYCWKEEGAGVQTLISSFLSAKPRASHQVTGQETSIAPGNGPKPEGGVAGQSIGKEKEEIFPLGKRLRPPEGHTGPGKSPGRAGWVSAGMEERTQERPEPQGGRKLPSLEEEGAAENNGKRLSEEKT